MSDLTYTVTIDGQPWREDQLRVVEYQRTLHVLHELKRLGVPIMDGDTELSDIDINWLDPERAEQISLDIRASMGEQKVLEVFKDVLADSARRWKGWAATYDPAKAHTMTTVIEAHGVGIEETMPIIGGAADERAALATNPEHYIIIGDIESGQRGMETFGMFGEPVYMHGVAQENLPEGLPVAKDPDFPIAMFGEMATKDDDTNFHVGAFHQFRPTEDGFVAKSTFVAPGDSPMAITEGHQVHFALEIVNSMKLAYAMKQKDAAEESALMSAAPAGSSSAVDGTWNVEARGQQGTFDLHADGDTLTGHIKVMAIEADIQDGTLNGSSFTGIVEADGPVGHVKAKLSGTVDGDSLTGTLKVGIMKTKLTGTRA